VAAAIDLCALAAVGVLLAMNLSGGGQASSATPPSPAPSVVTWSSAAPSPSPSSSATVSNRGGRFGWDPARSIRADVDGDGTADRVTITHVSGYQWRLKATLAAATCSGDIPGLPLTDPVLYGGYRPTGLDRDLVVASSSNVGDHITVNMWELGPTCQWTQIGAPADLGFGRTVLAAWSTQCTPDGLVVLTSQWTDQTFTRARTRALHLTLDGTSWKVARTVHFIQAGPVTKTLGALRCGGYAWHA
jgi:hypothetical protein